MTPQEIFDKVSTHLLNQNQRSVSFDSQGESYCAYRGNAGLTCAIGCLIEDCEYHPNMENCTVKRLILENEFLAKKFGQNIDLLVALQRVHDEFEIFEWANELKNIASNFNLNFVPPSKHCAKQ